MLSRGCVGGCHRRCSLQIADTSQRNYCGDIGTGAIEMDPPLRKAYEQLEDDIKNALKEHRGNQSVVSMALNALLLYPDRPFHIGQSLRE
jgi:hypothetical protein